MSTIRDKALTFYTGVFGFVQKHDIPVGEYRWITVVSAEGQRTSSCRLSPTPTGWARRSGAALQARHPGDGVRVSSVEQEYRRLKALGVVFTQEPKGQGPVTLAVCADTCGNLIQLYEPPA